MVLGGPPGDDPGDGPRGDHLGGGGPRGTSWGLRMVFWGVF